MSWLKTVAVELAGLFVEDGWFALAIVGWLIFCGLALPRLSLAPLWLGPIWFLGLAAILAASVIRGAAARHGRS